MITCCVQALGTGRDILTDVDEIEEIAANIHAGGAAPAALMPADDAVAGRPTQIPSPSHRRQYLVRAVFKALKDTDVLGKEQWRGLGRGTPR